MIQFKWWRFFWGGQTAVSPPTFRTHFILVALLLLAACQDDTAVAPIGDTTAVSNSSATKTPLAVLPYSNEAAFDLFYPSDWTYYLPRQGMMLFGEEKTLNQAQPGAMMTVLRVAPAAVHGNLEGEFNHFLDFGPKRDGYEPVGEQETVEINGRSALSQRFSFLGDGDEAIAMEASIVAAETESGAVYIFASTAPATDWLQHESKFGIMVASVVFNE